MVYGTHATTKRLGKRVQQATTCLPSKHKDHAKEAEEESRSKVIMRSLQIANDPRFKVIEHYKESDSTRLENIVGAAGGKIPRGFPEPVGLPEPIGRRSIYRTNTSQAIEGEDAGSDAKALAEGECTGFKNMTLERFQGRIGWEECFKANVKQLTVDFTLSSDPGCRLNHLDRMHSWFSKEGKKQTKKQAPCPNFLTFEKTSPAWPGSVRGVAQPFDTLTLDLAGVMRTPAKKRIEKHFGVVPTAPGRGEQTLPHPRGGFK